MTERVKIHRASRGCALIFNWLSACLSLERSGKSHTYQHAGIFFLGPFIYYLCVYDLLSLIKLTGTRSDGKLAHMGMQIQRDNVLIIRISTVQACLLLSLL